MPDSKANHPMPDYMEEPTQSPENPHLECDIQTSHSMDSTTGNLFGLDAPTLEILQAILQMIEKLEILQEAFPDHTLGSRDIPGTKLAVIREIAVLFRQQYEQSMQPEDLDMAIEFATRGVQLTPDDDSDRADWISELGLLYYLRFERLGDLEDLGRAIELMEQATLITPFDRPSKPGQLNNLGSSYQLLFEHLGRLDDLDKSFNCLEQAVMLTPDGHPDKPACLNNIGNSYQLLFERLGRLEDLDKSINYLEQAVILTPDGHPDKPGWLNNLSNSYQLLFECLGRLDDLDKSVNCNEQAVILTPDGHPHKPARLNNLGISYQLLFQRLGRLGDLDKSVNCKEQAVMLTPDGHPDKPAHLNNLGSSYQLLFGRLGRLGDLDKSVNCKKQAVMLTPDGHPDKPVQLNNLGISYQQLFERLGRLDDLDKSVNCKEQAVILTPDGHPDKPGQLNNLGNSYQLLFQRLGRLDDLDKSVNCNKQAVILTPDGHPDKPARLNNLGTSYQLLFQRLGRLDDLDKSVNCNEQAVMLTPDGHPDKPGQLNNLGISYKQLFQHLGRPDDLDKSVNCHEQAVTLTPGGHSNMRRWLGNLGDAYMLRFRRLGSLEDANLVAGCFRQAKQLTPDGHPQQSALLNALGGLHWEMFQRWHTPEHGSDAMNFHRSAALMQTGDPSLRLQASHRWALLSYFFDPLSLEGYMHCMTLLPLVVWLGTSVPQRYERLARDVGSLVTGAVATAISLQRYDLAVEWLEQGRSVVWGQTLQLRTSLDELYAINPELAQELQYVSHQIECASMSNPVEQVSQDSLSLHSIAWRHRRLAGRREELLAFARFLPGLEDFLRPPNASKLLDMVQTGVVVMINVYDDQCDALILHANPPAITHVPLEGFSVHEAEKVRDDLAPFLRARGSRRGFKKGDVTGKFTFKDILATLWHHIVKPVLDHLGITSPPDEDLPHITWCTTGYLSFLPLHAAGDYSDPSTVLSNLAISSYTPTLGSLGQRASSTSTFSGILAVGHESSIRNLIPLPGTKDELDQIQKWAEPLTFTRLDEEKACADTVLKEMGNHSWVHFACHASQNGMDPMKSALHLHDKDLDLATIARTPLKNAQLAFLSACQTATGDAGLPDESVHLAAGLLMAGYQTVIATMWSISDQDAPIVAGKVYECLLEGGVADSRKAAKALHYAVASLRQKIGEDEFARWVPYIHIGR